MRVIVVIVLFLLPASAFAQAEKRIALLVGNRAYDPSVGVLKNPLNDIAVVGEALAKQGFEVLPPIRDARRSAILGGVREWYASSIQLAPAQSDFSTTPVTVRRRRTPTSTT